MNAITLALIDAGFKPTPVRIAEPAAMVMGGDEARVERIEHFVWLEARDAVSNMRYQYQSNRMPGGTRNNQSWKHNRKKQWRWAA
jgi:hypothetical protein